MSTFDSDPASKNSGFREFFTHLFAIDDWRQSAFYIIFVSTFILETIPVFDALRDILGRTNSSLAAWLMLVCYTLILTGLILSSLPLRTRIWLGIASLYLYGTVLLAHTGTLSGGRTYLLIASLLASVLVSVKSGIILLVTSLIIPLALGKAYLLGLLDWNVSTILWKKWVISTVGHSMLGATLTISMTIIIRQLESSLIAAHNSRNLLEYRLKMEKLTAAISLRLGSAKTEQLKEAMQWTIQALGELMEVDRCYFYTVDFAQNTWNITHEWHTPKIPPLVEALRNVPMDTFVWWTNKMIHDEPIILNSIQDFAEEEPVLYEMLDQSDIKSVLAVPLINEKVFYGFMGFDTTHSQRDWNVDDVQLLRTIGSIYTGSKQRINYERELVESERRYRMLVENAPIGVVLVDEQGHVLETNASAESLVDIPQFPQGQSLLELENLSESDFAAEFKQCLFEGAHCSGEALYGQDTGMEHWVRYHLARMDFGDDQHKRVLVIVEDISSEHALQETINRSQRMEALGRLAGGVAHDFNNLLTVINGYMEMALESPNLDPALRDDLVTVADAGNKASQLTSQLLLFSRRQESQVQCIDVNQLLQDLRKLLRRLVDESIELDLDCTDEPCYIQGDSSQIEQVIMNLVVNARDAIHEGGKIRVGTRRITIDPERAQVLPDAKTGEHVQIFVQDSGTGMTPEVMQHIFEPFFTTKEVNKGTGLGLATVYGIITQVGGHITVDSEQGKGSTFYVNIPFSYDGIEQDVSHQTHTEGEKLERIYNILLVEDDSTVRQLIRRALESMGYTVTSVQNAKAAIQAFKGEEKIALVISDIVMPGMSGIKLAQNLLASRPEIPVILMSGYPQDVEELQELIHQGVRLLLKPVKRQDLQGMIHQMLD